MTISINDITKSYSAIKSKFLSAFNDALKGRYTKSVDGRLTLGEALELLEGHRLSVNDQFKVSVLLMDTANANGGWDTPTFTKQDIGAIFFSQNSLKFDNPRAAKKAFDDNLSKAVEQVYQEQKELVNQSLGEQLNKLL